MWAIFRFTLGDPRSIGIKKWLKNFRHLVYPWRSEYIRWRMLTVFQTSENLTPREFWATIIKNRKQLFEWLRWDKHMRG